MKYVVAVSGGVDSMVLLDMMLRVNPGGIIVAHFDHGIRPDSHKDAEFVKDVAGRYGLILESSREELGAGASEELARNRRYRFLRSVAEKYNARLVTAHHLDDLVETVAINLTRGTGWRGLAVFGADVSRPLIDKQKSELVDYARRHKIEWREDPTNSTKAYLRNRLRGAVASLTLDQKMQIRALQSSQSELRSSIESEVNGLTSSGDWHSRYFYIMAKPAAALECIYNITGGRLTRPQMARMLHAIKVAAPNTTFEAGNGVRVYFSTRQFSL